MHPDKKKALIEILQQLVGHWNLAEGFLILVKEAKDDTLADDLLRLIHDQVKKIENQEKQKNIYNQLKMIKKHNFEMEQERKEAENLLDSLLTSIEE